MSTDAKPYGPKSDLPWAYARNSRMVATLDERDSLRAELAASESLVTALQEQMARLAEQHAKAVAEAREEQREACARQAGIRSAEVARECNADYALLRPEGIEHAAAEAIRATPLDSTPLAARIAELEAERDAIAEDEESAQRLLDAALCEGEPGTTSMETLSERLPRLIHQRDLLLRSGLDLKERQEAAESAIVAEAKR